MRPPREQQHQHQQWGWQAGSTPNLPFMGRDKPHTGPWPRPPYPVPPQSSQPGPHHSGGMGAAPKVCIAEFLTSIMSDLVNHCPSHVA